MNGDQAAYALYLVLFLVLVASSLAARRLPMRQTLKMAAAWVAIFAVGFIIFSFRSEFTALGARGGRIADPARRGAAHPQGG